MILVVWLIGSGSASAAAYTWNVAGGGSWGTGTNWTPNGVPGASDTVAIGTVTAGSAITLDGSRSITSLTLTGANDFTISAGTGGTLTLTSSGTAIGESGTGQPTITCPVALGANQTWTSSNGNAPIVSGQISGAFTLSTSGGWILSGANTLSQTITVTANTLAAAANDALGTIAGGVTVSTGASLGFQGGITYTTAEPVTVNGDGALSDGAVVNVSGTNSFAGPLTLGGNGRIGSRAGTLTLAGTIDYGANTLSAAGVGSVVCSNVISGSGQFHKIDSGILTLSGANTFTGFMIVFGGSVYANNTTGAAIGTGNVQMNSGTTLGGSGTIAGEVSGDGVLSPGAAAGAIGTLTLSRADPVPTSNSPYTLAIDINGANSDTLLCSAASGVLTLNNINLAITSVSPTVDSYTLISYPSGSLTGAFMSVTGLPAGYTVLYSRTAIKLVSGRSLLSWNFGTATGGQASSAATTVAPGLAASTIIRGAGSPAADSYITRGWGQLNTRESWNQATLTNAKTANSYLEFTITPTANRTLSLSHLVVAPYQQTARASSTLAVEYSFDGFTTAGVAMGTISNIRDDWRGMRTALDLSGLAALQGFTGTVTIRLWAYGFTETDGTGFYDDHGLGFLDGGEDVTVIGSLAVSEPNTLEVWTGAGGDSNWNTNANWEDGSFPDSGDDVWFPDVTNQTVTMNVAATVGTVTFDAPDAYTVAGASALTPGGVTQSGAGTVAISAPVATGGAARTLTGAGTGVVTLSGVVSGTGGLTKSGTGSAALSAANTYSGTTTVSAGTLIVTGAQGSSAVALSGGTLRGTGTVGAITGTSGTIQPGTSASYTALSTSTADLSAVTTRVRIAGFTAGTNHDRLACSGALTLGGSGTLALDLTGVAATGTAAGIITCSGLPSGTFSAVSVTNNPNNYNISVTYASGSVNVAVTAAGARALYWHPQGTSTNPSVAGNWTTDQAGTSPVTILNAVDTLRFDGTGATADNACTMAGAQTCAAIDFTGYSGTFTDGGQILTVTGNATFVAGMTLTATGTLAMNNGGTLTTGGKILMGISTSGGSLALGDNLTMAGILSMTGGTLTVGSAYSLTTTGTGTTVTVASGATLINQGTLSISGTGPAMYGTLDTSAVGNLVRYTGQADNAAVKIPMLAYHHLEVAKAGTTFAFATGIRREYYAGVGGTAVSDLTAAAIYPNSPTLTSVITDWFEGPTNAADDYGSRYRTFVMPPTTGSYRFWIASDDASELWVATDGIAANAVKVAQVNAWTDPRQWTKEVNQQSNAVALVAGQPCYVMALHKEGGGGDNLAVGWTGPASLDERPIPASRCDPSISGTGSAIIAGNLTITAGTFQAPSGSLSVAGNWSNSGSFAAGSGTVVLAGAGGSTQVVSGSTTFHHLTATCTAARTLQFAAGSTQTVGGNLVLTGGSGQLLSLTSGTPGAAWNLNSTGGIASRTCSYLHVSDGTNLDATFILPANSVDGGNTVRWFLAANTWISATADLWSNAAKWSLGHVPTASETATFTSANNGSCTLDAATQVAGSLVFSAGYAGTFDLGSNLLDITAAHADFTGLTALTGTGTVRFSSTGIQRMTPNGLSHANITHIGGGTLTLMGNLSCQSLANSSGGLDVNGRNITCAGNLTISNGTTATLSNIGGATVTVGGDASFAGQSGNLLNLHSSTGSAWFITVTGALSANYAAIGSSDASGGVSGYATNSADYSRNSNWGFGSTTFYWHQSQPLLSTDFNRACNWTSAQGGGGRRPSSSRDDQFGLSSLDAGVWTYRDNIADGYSSQSLAANAGRLTMTARGSDVFGTTFGYAGVHRSDLTGNAFDVTVYVESMTNTHSNAKAGIMAMNNVTDPGQGGVIAVNIMPGGNAEMIYASAVNGNIDTFVNVAMTAPCYLRLARNGTGFSTFCKKNITDSWTMIGTAVTPAGTAAGTSSQIMLITSSRNTSATCTAVFDDFQAGTAMNAVDNTLSFNGSGTGSQANATMSADQTVAVVDFTGSNGYAGTFDFNGRTLTVGPGTGSASTTLTDTTDAQTGTITAQGENGAGEGMAKAFDNDINSKWLDFANDFPATRSSWIQYLYPGSVTKVLNAYSISSANDIPARDPRDWRIFGIDSLGAETLLDTQTAQSFASRLLTKSYTIANTTAYRGYKLVIDSVMDPPAAGCVQLAEIEFLSANSIVAAGSASFNQPSLTLAATGGGTLAFIGGIAHQFTPQAGGVFPNLLLSGSGGTTLLANDLILSGNVTIAAGTFDSGGRNITVAGNWSNNATFTAGSGTVTLSGASATTQTISATTTTLGRQFSLLQVTGGAAVALADAANANALTIATASAFTLSGSPLTLRSGTLTRSDVTGTEGLHTVSCDVVLGAAGIWTNSTTDSRMAVSGVVSGAFALTTQGAGTTSLSGANTYSGGTTVAAGTLLASNGSGSATGSGAVTIASGATLGGTGSLAGAVTVQDGGIVAPGVGGAGTLTLTAASTTALALNASSVLHVDLGTSSDLIACSGAAAALTLDGTINITAGAGFASGTYTIITYSGALTDNTLVVGTRPANCSATIRTSVSGQVQVVILADADGVNEIWTGAGADANWTTNANWNDGSYPDVGDNISFPDVTNQTVSMNLAATVGTITFNASDAYTVNGASALTLGGTVTQSGSGTVAISAPVATGNVARTLTGAGSGLVTLSGVISGSGGLTKAGAVSITFSGANTYADGTTVSAGSLWANNTTGSGTGSGTVSVSAGATLGGSGTIAGVVTTANTATLSPGASSGAVGTLTLSAASPLSPSGTTTLAVDISGASTDLVTCSAASGSLSLGSLALSISSTAPTAGSFTLISYASGSISGTFASVSGIPAGYVLVYSSRSVALVSGSVLLGWDFGTTDGSQASATPTTVAMGIQSSTITRGAGSVAVAVAAFSGKGALNVRSWSAANLAGAKTANAYFETTFAPYTGWSASLSSLVIATYQQNTHSESTIVGEYSLDGFATAGVSIGVVNPVNNAWSGRPTAFDLSGIPALQGITTTITFRFYGYGFTSFEDKGFGQVDGANDDVRFIGSVVSLDSSGASEVWTGAGPDSAFATNYNWSDNSAPAANDSVSFPDVVNQTVTMGAAATVGTMTFTAADAYIVNGASTLTLGGTVTQSGAGTVTISAPVATGNAARTLSGAGSGVATISGVVSGSGILTKAGGGTWTLAGANTYSDPTAVNAGTLLVTGSTVATSTVTVASGATLGGTGTIAGVTTIQDGATLAPGSATASAGTLTLTTAGATALSLAGTSVLAYELGTTSDLVALTGVGANLTLDGTVNVSAATGFAAGTYTLITYTGSLVNNTLTVGTMPAGFAATVDVSVAGQVRLVCSALAYTARETSDSAGNGRIDRIRITTTGTLNDDFSGMTATVAGYTVTGFSTGATANDNEFFIVFTEGGTADTAAVPAVQITANSSLRPAAGNGLYGTDPVSVTPTDKAKPVLIASTWTDGDANGVDAGDTVTLTFSEAVSTSGMLVADLGLPVSGDSFATSTIANQATTATVSVALVGVPYLSPGGSYASAATAAGAASGVYLSSGANLSDAAANGGHVQSAATAVDLGPTTATALSVAWATGSDPKAWAIGTVLAGATANTVATPDLNIRNLSTGAVQLLVRTTNSSPSAWSPAGAAGTNAFLMKCDNAGTASAGAGPTTAANYALTLTTSNQVMHSLVYSGVLADFELYFAAPSTITIGGGQQQTITVTITAQVPP